MSDLDVDRLSRYSTILPRLPLSSTPPSPLIRLELCLDIGNLHPTTTESDLKDALKQFRLEVSSILVVRDSVTQQSLGYGYVSFLSEVDLEGALLHMNFLVVKERPISLARVSSHGPKAYNQHANLHFNHVPPSIPETDLHTIFSQFDVVLSLRRVHGKDGTPTSYGYVQLGSVEGSRRALDAAHRGKISHHGKIIPILLTPFVPKSARPKPPFTNVLIKNYPTTWKKHHFENFVKQYGEVTSVYFPIRRTSEYDHDPPIESPLFGPFSGGSDILHVQPIRDLPPISDYGLTPTFPKLTQTWSEHHEQADRDREAASTNVHPNRPPSPSSPELLAKFLSQQRMLSEEAGGEERERQSYIGSENDADAPNDAFTYNATDALVLNDDDNNNNNNPKNINHDKHSSGHHPNDVIPRPIVLEPQSSDPTVKTKAHLLTPQHHTMTSSSHLPSVPVPVSTIEQDVMTALAQDTQDSPSQRNSMRYDNPTGYSQISRQYPSTTTGRMGARQSIQLDDDPTHTSHITSQLFDTHLSSSSTPPLVPSSIAQDPSGVSHGGSEHISTHASMDPRASLSPRRETQDAPQTPLHGKDSIQGAGGDNLYRDGDRDSGHLSQQSLGGTHTHDLSLVTRQDHTFSTPDQVQISDSRSRLRHQSAASGSGGDPSYHPPLASTSASLWHSGNDQLRLTDSFPQITHPNRDNDNRQRDDSFMLATTHHDMPTDHHHRGQNEAFADMATLPFSKHSSDDISRLSTATPNVFRSTSGHSSSYLPMLSGNGNAPLTGLSSHKNPNFEPALSHVQYDLPTSASFSSQHVMGVGGGLGPSSTSSRFPQSRDVFGGSGEIPGATSGAYDPLAQLADLQYTEPSLPGDITRQSSGSGSTTGLPQPLHAHGALSTTEDGLRQHQYPLQLSPHQQQLQQQYSADQPPSSYLPNGFHPLSSNLSSHNSFINNSLSLRTSGHGHSSMGFMPVSPVPPVTSLHQQHQQQPLYYQNQNYNYNQNYTQGYTQGYNQNYSNPSQQYMNGNPHTHAMSTFAPSSHTFGVYSTHSGTSHHYSPSVAPSMRSAVSYGNSSTRSGTGQTFGFANYATHEAALNAIRLINSDPVNIYVPPSLPPISGNLSKLTIQSLGITPCADNAENDDAKDGVTATDHSQYTVGGTDPTSKEHSHPYSSLYDGSPTLSKGGGSYGTSFHYQPQLQNQYNQYNHPSRTSSNYPELSIQSPLTPIKIEAAKAGKTDTSRNRPNGINRRGGDTSSSHYRFEPRTSPNICEVFVNHIDTTQYDRASLEQIFQSCGDMLDFQLDTGKDPRRAIAYIQYKTTRAAQIAVKTLPVRSNGRWFADFSHRKSSLRDYVTNRTHLVIHTTSAATANPAVNPVGSTTTSSTSSSLKQLPTNTTNSSSSSAVAGTASAGTTPVTTDTTRDSHKLTPQRAANQFKEPTSSDGHPSSVT